MPADLTAPELDRLVRRLRAAGCVFAEDEAALLAAEAADSAGLERMTVRRETGDPLEQVVGWAQFCGLRITVEPGVFVPRRRTELLARTAAARAQAVGPGARVVDLCCGSGAVGAVVAARVPGVRLWAVDIDPVAVRCARGNLAEAGEVLRGDLDAPLPATLRGLVDVLVANAPYVPTGEIAMMPPEARDHEPSVALDGGVDGVELQRRVAAAAPGWLRPGGRLLIETSRRQARATLAACAAHGLSARVLRDHQLDATVVEATAAGTTS